MNKTGPKKLGLKFLNKWWCSLLLLPLILYSLHQCYRALGFNSFFSISYDFPFPVNIIYLFLDNFLLIIHEAGHTFFSLFGWRTLTILGGSLLEIAIPLLILAYFAINRIKTGIQFSLFFVGFSILQVAFYIADAGARQLPLLGGLSKEAHDWHNLLSGWNIIEQDTAIALTMSILAAVLYIVALLLPFFFRSFKSVTINLNL